MKTHTTLKLTVASLVLAFIPNVRGQTPSPDPQTGRKGGESALQGRVSPIGLPPEDVRKDATDISIAYEAFSLPLAKAAELRRKGLTDSNLYAELLAAGKLERLIVVQGKPNNRAVVTCGTDYLYPTEFSPPHPPADPGDKRPDEKRGVRATAPSDLPSGSFCANPTTPTAFEMRQLGDSVDIEPTLSPDDRTVDLQIVVSHVTFVGREKWGHGLGEIEQPQFESQKINTIVSAPIGSPRFIGTLSFPPGNGLVARAEQNVWFCFITPTLAPNKTAPQKKSAR